MKSALAWAAKGFRVFPLTRNSKTPRDKEFFNSATAVAEDVTKLFKGDTQYNVGVLCDNMLVVDLDVKSGKDGLASFIDLDMPMNTLVVRTPTGGYHYYYNAPSTMNTQGNTGRGLAPGVDTRSYHGYVIAPGSSTKDGVYTLEQDVPMVNAPQHIVARLSTPFERKKRGEDLDLEDGIAIKAAEAFLELAPPAIEGQGGDQLAYETAKKLRDIGLTELTAFHMMLELWNPRCDPPWESEHLERKVANGFLYASNPNGLLNPRIAFAGVTIDQPVAKGRHWIRHGEPWEKDFQWLFWKILPTTGVAILTGPPSSGKTFIAAHIAEKLATGEPLFGVSPDHRRATIFLAAEGAGSLGPRLSVLGRGHGQLPISATFIGTVADTSAWTEVRKDLHTEYDRIEKQFDMQVGLIVLDTLSASGLVADENNNTDCAKALKKLDELGRELGCLVLVLHHPPKAGVGLRGGSAIRASADYVLEIERAEGKHVRKLRIDKAREAEEKVLGYFELKIEVTGKDIKGRDITTCTVNVAAEPAHATAAPPLWDVFVQCIDWARTMTKTPTDKPVLLDAVEEEFTGRRDRDVTLSASRKAFMTCKDHAYKTDAVKSIPSAQGITIMEFQPDL